MIYFCVRSIISNADPQNISSSMLVALWVASITANFTFPLITPAHYVKEATTQPHRSEILTSIIDKHLICSIRCCQFVGIGKADFRTKSE